MSALENVMIAENATIEAAIRILDRGEEKIVLVVDGERRLIGTITDGDIRRGLLSGVSLADRVALVMNRNPTVAREGADRSHLVAMMRSRLFRQIPLVDGDGRVVGVETLDDLTTPPFHENRVVLMAGGRGSRLRPMTDDCPKPMLCLGSKPILETILDGLIDQGFRRFSIAVNYLAEQVREHFGDGASRGIAIDYLEEHDFLGTAGALSLIGEREQLPLLVVNGDVLTKVDFQALLAFHMEHRAAATMCVREYVHENPYGVVETCQHRIARISEKPVQRYLVNAGIYVLQPEVVELIPHSRPIDMPRLFEMAMAAGYEAVVFPVSEYWIDIGQMDELDRARLEFPKEFEGETG